MSLRRCNIHATPALCHPEAPSRAVVSVAGEDAKDFLQSLVTADIDGAEARRGGLFRAAEPARQDPVRLLHRWPRTDAMRSTARKRKRPTPQAARLLQTAGQGERDATATKKWGLPRRSPPTGSPCRSARGRSLANASSPRRAAWPKPSEQAYRGGRIGLGIADSDADIGSGELFPHEANLDQLGAVSFKKGCFIGQEVVSRMEHRGTARNRIVPVYSPREAPPKAAPSPRAARPSARCSRRRTSDALALIRLDRLKDAVGGR